MTLACPPAERSTAHAESALAACGQAAQGEGGDQKAIKKRGFRRHARVQQREGEQRDQPERGGRKQTQEKGHHCLRPVHATGEIGSSRKTGRDCSVLDSKWTGLPYVREACSSEIYQADLKQINFEILQALLSMPVRPWATGTALRVALRGAPHRVRA